MACTDVPHILLIFACSLLHTVSYPLNCSTALSHPSGAGRHTNRVIKLKLSIFANEECKIGTLGYVLLKAPEIVLCVIRTL